MPNDSLPAAVSDSWQSFVAAEHDYVSTRMTLLSDHSSRLSSVRNGLHEPAERSAALSVAALLPTREKQQLLPDLLELAAFTHGLTRQARNIILSMGRDWLEKNIESHAEPILMRNDDEEYAGLLELYKRIRRDLALRLATRAAQHADPAIREVGEDFLADLEPSRPIKRHSPV